MLVHCKNKEIYKKPDNLSSGNTCTNIRTAEARDKADARAAARDAVTIEEACIMNDNAED